MPNQEKTIKVLKKREVLKNDLALGIAGELTNIEDKVDTLANNMNEVIDKLNQPEGIKPEVQKISLEGVSVITIKGDSPTEEELLALIEPLIPRAEDGKDYILTEKDKKDIAKSIKVPFVEKIIEKTETIIEQPIVTNEIKEVAVVESAEDIVAKINDLPTDEDDFKIDAKHIKNLPKQENRIHNVGVSNKYLEQLLDVNLDTATKDAQGKYIIGSGAGGSSTYTALTDATTVNLPTVNTPLSIALAAKESTISAGTTSEYYRGDKTFQTLDKTAVGIGNVDNTSDANKPVSTATQTALNLKQNLSEKDVASGYAGLDVSGKINPSQLPALAISDTFVVASQAAQVALTAEVGDIAVRTDLNKSYILRVSPATIFANWQELLTPTDSVTSVFGRTAVVTAQNGDYTASQITNVPAGTIGAVTVQAALNELDTEKSAVGHTHVLANVIDVTITPANLNSLDNGVDSTLHFHASDRARANHTGTQLSSTISDFATTVRSTILTGISFATSTAVTITDSILVAIGKLQAQNTEQDTVIASKVQSIIAGTNITLGGTATNPVINATGGGGGLTWEFLVLNWSIEPTSVNILNGEASIYTLLGTTRYRFVPTVYNPTQDAFYSNFDGTTLTNLITTRG